MICDGYGSSGGFISLERRWVDAGIRLGINEHTVGKWKKMYEVKKDLENHTHMELEEILGIRG
jgi:hypothetical protein